MKARSQFKDRSTATSVEIMLPLPPDAISPIFKTSQVRTPYVYGLSKTSCRLREVPKLEILYV